MGMSASQMRYLALTARQTDLEYQAQMINNARLTLAENSSAAAKAYTDGMNNKTIRMAHYETGDNKLSKKVWESLTYSNLMEQGFQVIGSQGATIEPSPYYEYAEGRTFSYSEYMNLPASERAKCMMDGTQTYKINEEFIAFASGSKITQAQWDTLSDDEKAKCGAFDETTKTYPVTADISFAEGSDISYAKYLAISVTKREKCTCNNDCNFIAKSRLRILNPDYKGMDIQTFLMSGQGQIVTNTFFQFLCRHGYGTGCYVETDKDGKEIPATYERIMELFQNQYPDTHMVMDWRADATSTFVEELYTEDDAQVLANYEATTAEIQMEDKRLEMQLKRIETEHKAIETEMEAVKKVIDKNIENTYKTFG